MSKSKKFDYWLFDSDSEDDAEESPVTAPMVAVGTKRNIEEVLEQAPVASVIPNTLLPNATDTGDSNDNFPVGISRVGNKFGIRTRNVATGKRTWHLFKTLVEATAAKAAECVKMEAHKYQKQENRLKEHAAAKAIKHAKRAEQALQKKEIRFKERESIRQTLPKGIVMSNGNQFQIHARNMETSKETTLVYNTLDEAKMALAVKHAKRLEIKRQKAALPQAEIRADNLAVFGNSSKKEREFALQMCAFESNIKLMNDSVLTDTCGFFYADDPSLALGIQLKTTGGTVKGRPNTWQFLAVKGYAGIPVVCWRIQEQDGWVFDGADLDRHDTINLKITFNGVNCKLALSGVEPLKLDGIVKFLKGDNVAGDRVRFPPHSQDFFSWQFHGKAHTHLVERIGLHLEMKRDCHAYFPSEQAGSVDLLGSYGARRKQLKTAQMLQKHTGLRADLHEYSGRIEGKPTYRPYPAGAFDEVVVYHFDWKTNTVYSWRIPEFELVEKGYLRTSTQVGRKCLYVYTSAEWQISAGPIPDTWTFAYYEGTQPITLPPEAEAAAGHLLADLRSGRVK
jgi:hypothetical protein